MSKPPDDSPILHTSTESVDDKSAIKRPKITFLNPSELHVLEGQQSQHTVTKTDVSLYQRFLGRQVQVNQSKKNAEVTEMEEEVQLKKRKTREKSAKIKSKRRSIDPKRPWLVSDDEEDERAVTVEDESDDDEFLQRLLEEKEREEAEENQRKLELQHQRELKKAAKLAKKAGKVGRPKLNSALNNSYAHSRNDPHSSKPSEVSDEEGVSNFNMYEDDYDTDNHSSAQRSEFESLQQIPSVENEDYEMDTTDLAITSEEFALESTSKLDIVSLRRQAPHLTLPPSSNDLICPSEHILDALAIYETVQRYGRLLRLSPFSVEAFISALSANENSAILAEIHIALMRVLMQEDEANGTQICPPDCKDATSLFYFLVDQYSWPYLLSLYLTSIQKGEPVAVAAAERLVSLSQSATYVAGANLTGGPSVGGGADIVLTAALFSDGIIPLDTAYPFVDISIRVAVLRGLVGLFLATGPVRGDILREGFTAHDDFCRVCRQSGEVLCCDNCPAVFHLICLTPPLEAVPSVSWNCPICQAEQAIYGEDTVPKPTGHNRILPLGYDRAGRVYWNLASRIIVEPVDFAEREPHLPGLMEGVRDEDWEREEMEDALGLHDDGTGEEKEKHLCDPTKAYTNEPTSYYYSSLADIEVLRSRLSHQWETELCDQLDGLITARWREEEEKKTRKQENVSVSDRSTSSKPEGTIENEDLKITMEIETKKEKPEVKPEPVADKMYDGNPKWPALIPLLPPLTPVQLTTLFSATPQDAVPLEKAFILELSGGILIRNQDGLFENFPISTDEYASRLAENCPSLVTKSDAPGNCLSPNWRAWRNLHSTGILVPNTLGADDDGVAPLVNIVLNRVQLHDEKERRRLLANKFMMTDAVIDAWSWFDAEQVMWMAKRVLKNNGEDGGDDAYDEDEEVEKGGMSKEQEKKKRRAEAVGPSKWLHTLKLTLCFVEAQLPLASLSPVWRMYRKDWISAVLSSTSVAELADLLGRLEAAIRPINFIRVWNSSLGPLCLERYTALQREDEKRMRALERQSGLSSAAAVAAVTGANGNGSNGSSSVSLSLVRTKTPTPIRHTVWKFRGEEYRRLGGSGWCWLSATRRQQSPPYAGCLRMPSSLPLFYLDETEEGNEAMKLSDVSKAFHARAAAEKGEKDKDEEVKEIRGHRHRRRSFRLTSLLVLREKTAKQDIEAGEGARDEVDRLRTERDEIQKKLEEARVKLNELSQQAQEARSEHARAVKDRQTAIAQLRQQSALNDYRYGRRGRRPGVRGRPGRPPRRPQLNREDFYSSDEDDEGNLGRRIREDEEGSVSPQASSITQGSNTVRRSARKQKAVRRDPDFVVDFDDEEEDDVNSEGEHDLDNDRDERSEGLAIDEMHDDEYGATQLRIASSRQASASNVQDWVAAGSDSIQRLPQFDGADDDADNTVDSDKVCDKEESAVETVKSTAPIVASQPTALNTVLNKVNSPKNLIMSSTMPDGKPGLVSLRPVNMENLPKPLQNGLASLQSGVIPSGASTQSITAISASGQPVRLVRVLRAPLGSPAGAQVIQAVDGSAVSMPSNLVFPSPGSQSLHKSLVKISSSGGVIVTQASALPTGYRLVNPNSSVALMPSGTGTPTTSAAASGRPLNFVKVVMSGQDGSGPTTQLIPTGPTQVAVRSPTLQQSGAPIARRPSTMMRALAPSPGGAGYVSIAPNPNMPGSTQLIRPLLAPNQRPGLMPLASSMRPRMVHVMQQPRTIDPSFDLAISTAATAVNNLDAQLSSMRAQILDLEKQLLELNSELMEKEILASRTLRSPALPYSLNTAMVQDTTFARLQRAASAQPFRRGQNWKPKDARRFLRLPKHPPVVSPYAWPPGPLYYKQISTYSTDELGPRETPVASLFRLHPVTLRGVILAAGRREMPGYESEKKRLVHIVWPYPSARPSFAETWRFRLRQVLHESLSLSNMPECCPSTKQGVHLASFALHLRILWHSLRWDDLTSCAETVDDAMVDCFDRFCLREPLGETGTGDYQLRRVAAIQPLDKFWLRANFLLHTTVHKKQTALSSTRSRRTRSGRTGATSRANDDNNTRARGSAGRGGPGGGRSRKDPDYDPAADEGWRVGIPCSARAQRRLNGGGGRWPRRRADSGDEDDSDDFGDDDDDTESHDRGVEEKEEWVAEESLNVWEIRNFLDTMIPIDDDYPPRMPKLVLASLPSGLAAEFDSKKKLENEKEDEDGEEKGTEVDAKVTTIRSWTQPARLPSPEPPRPATPPPVEVPKPPPPIPTSVAFPVALRSGPLVAVSPASTNLSLEAATRSDSAPQPIFRPLIVSSSAPSVFTNTLSNIPYPVQRPIIDNDPMPPTRGRRGRGWPRGAASGVGGRALSPASESARARARSLQASQVAKATAALRRLRAERANLEIRSNQLAEALANRRRLTVKLLTLRAHEEIYQLKAKKEQEKKDLRASPQAIEADEDDDDISDGPTVSLSPLPSNRVKDTSAVPVPGRKRGRPSIKHSGIARQLGIQALSGLGVSPPGSDSEQLARVAIEAKRPILPKNTHSARPPTSKTAESTPDTSPCGNSSDEENLAMPVLPPLKKMFDLEEVIRKCNQAKVTHLSPPGRGQIRGRRPGRPRGSANRSTGHPKSPPKLSTPHTLGRVHRGIRAKGPRGSLRGAPSARGGRLPIRPPSYLLNKSGSDSEDEEEEEANKLYCVCKMPYDEAQEYIGCDACQDWFHFACVGLKPGVTAELGDSWFCPACKDKETIHLKKEKDEDFKEEENEEGELYCLCRTPYEPSRVYIACDRCDEWYHAECVNMEPDVAANHEGIYMCPPCQKTSAKEGPSAVNHKEDEEVPSSRRSSSSSSSAPIGKDAEPLIEILLDDMLKHSMVFPVMKRPSTTDIENVGVRLTEPFDLPTFVEEFKSGAYRSFEDFSFAGNQLFSNARLLHRNSPENLQCVKALEAFYLSHLKGIKAQVVAKTG